MKLAIVSRFGLELAGTNQTAAGQLVTCSMGGDGLKYVTKKPNNIQIRTVLF